MNARKTIKLKGNLRLNHFTMRDSDRNFTTIR
jgi:hypothetical protein